MISKRFTILITLTVLLGLGGGFAFGRLDDKYLIQLGIKPPITRLLVEDRALFPENLQSVLEKETGLKFDVQVYRNEKSLKEMTPYFDIFLGSTCLLEQMKMESEDLQNIVSLEKTISPDFLTINQRQKFAIPLLWNYDSEKGFQVISMRIKKKKRGYLRELAKIWLQNDFLQRWSETTDFATTYMTLDESSLEPELKASWLRTISLSKLSLLDKTSCKN